MSGRNTIEGIDKSCVSREEEDGQRNTIEHAKRIFVIERLIPSCICPTNSTVSHHCQLTPSSHGHLFCRVQ